MELRQIWEWKRGCAGLSPASFCHFQALCSARLLGEATWTQRLRRSRRWAGPRWSGGQARSGLTLLSVKPQKSDGYQVGAESPKDPWNPVHDNPGQVGGRIRP